MKRNSGLKIRLIKFSSIGIPKYIRRNVAISELFTRYKFFRNSTLDGSGILILIIKNHRYVINVETKNTMPPISMPHHCLLIAKMSSWSHSRRTDGTTSQSQKEKQANHRRPNRPFFFQNFFQGDETIMLFEVRVRTAMKPLIVKKKSKKKSKL